MLDSRRAKGLRLGLWCILAFLSLFAAERSAQLETRQAALRNALPDVLHTLALSSQVVNSRGPAIAGEPSSSLVSPDPAQSVLVLLINFMVVRMTVTQSHRLPVRPLRLTGMRPPHTREARASLGPLKSVA